MKVFLSTFFVGSKKELITMAEVAAFHQTSSPAFSRIKEREHLFTYVHFLSKENLSLALNFLSEDKILKGG